MGSRMQQTTLDDVFKKCKDEYGFKGYQVKIRSTNYVRAFYISSSKLVENDSPQPRISTISDDENDEINYHD